MRLEGWQWGLVVSVRPLRLRLADISPHLLLLLPQLAFLRQASHQTSSDRRLLSSPPFASGEHLPQPLLSGLAVSVDESCILRRGPGSYV